jgi:hypothetical protein
MKISAVVKPWIAILILLLAAASGIRASVAHNRPDLKDPVRFS